MAPPDPDTRIVLVDLADAEVAATFIRLCAQLDIAASLKDDSQGELPVLCMVREEADSLTIQNAQLPPVSLARPLRMHQVRRILERQALHIHPVSEHIMLGAHLRLHIHRRQICRISGESLSDLTEKETELLAYLHQAGENGAEREELLAELWKYHPDAETRTVDSHLYRLRQKLAELPEDESVEIIVQQGHYVLIIK